MRIKVVVRIVPGWTSGLGSGLLSGHVAALVRSHAIGLLPFRLTKEQTTQTMDPSPKTIELLHYPGQWNFELTGSCYSTVIIKVINQCLVSSWASPPSTYAICIVFLGYWFKRWSPWRIWGEATWRGMRGSDSVTGTWTVQFIHDIALRYLSGWHCFTECVFHFQHWTPGQNGQFANRTRYFEGVVQQCFQTCTTVKFIRAIWKKL